MRRVLFVDDEAGILDGLRRMLRPMRSEWEMVFVATGPEALVEAERRPFDLIVTDMRMPGMDGATLLDHFHRRFPGTLRFALSGYSEKETAMRASPAAHRFLTKPCTPDELRGAINRSLLLTDLVADKAVRRLVHGLAALPPAPHVVEQLTRALDRADEDRVIAVIGSCPALTAKLLHLVNSTLFDQPGTVGSVRRAVDLLGVNLLRDLLAVTEVFDAPPLPTDLDLLQQRVRAEAQATSAVARRIQGPGWGEEAAVAGLLHDIGLLVLAAGAPDVLRATLDRCRFEQRPLVDIEAEWNRTTHAQLGGYLLGLWGLPDVVVDAVANHHRPRSAPTDRASVVTAVHVAGALVEVSADRPGGWITHRLDRVHLEASGAAGQLDRWRLLVGEGSGAGWPVGVPQ